MELQQKRGRSVCVGSAANRGMPQASFDPALLTGLVKNMVTRLQWQIARIW